MTNNDYNGFTGIQASRMILAKLVLIAVNGCSYSEIVLKRARKGSR